MTHPDDEISICAWIRELTKAEIEVHLSWTHHTPVRKGEAEKAAAFLGVPSDRLYFHEGSDGRICDQMPDLLPSIQKMVETVRPDRICCGAFEQGHLDHDATNMMVNRCFAGPVQEIPFYHTYLTRRPIVNRFAQPDGQEIRALSEDDQCLKVACARLYPSQRIFQNLLLAEARRIVTNRSETALKSTERMRLQTHTDFLSPSLPEPLAGRVRCSRPWARWVHAARAIL